MHIHLKVWHFSLQRESNNFKDIELDDDHGDNEAAVLRTIASELPDFENGGIRIHILLQSTTM